VPAGWFYGFPATAREQVVSEQPSFPGVDHWCGLLMGRTSQTIYLPYGGAVIFTALAVLLRWLVDPWMGDDLPLVTLYGAIAFAVWYGGCRPALLAVALGYLVCDYLFMAPRGSFALQDAHQYIGLALYLFTCAFIVGFGELMRRTKTIATASATAVERDGEPLPKEIRLPQHDAVAVQNARLYDALHQSEQRFARFMHHLPGLAWIKDMHGRYVYANDAAIKAFDCPRDQLIGRTDDEVFPQATAAEFNQNDQKALTSEAGVQIIEDLEHPDGTVHHSVVSKFPILGPEGTPALVGGMAIDITDRLRAEETVRSLLRISEQLKSTLDVEELLDLLVTEAIRLVDAESGVSGLNSAEGMRCQRYFQHGKRLELSYCWPPMHGLPGWLLVHKVPYLTNDAMTDPQIVHELCVQFGVRSALSTPILNAQGEVLGFFEIHNKEGGFTPTDQEKLLAVSHAASIAIQNALAYRRIQQTETSLQDANRRKDEFLATLAHELRNPLAPIRNAVELMRRANGDAALREKARSMMERQVAQMVRLVDDLLDVSRITRGKLQLRKERVELAEVVRSAVEAARPVIDTHAHQLTISLPATPIHLDADPIRVAQMLANLLNNAAKYTEKGGHIWLTADAQDNQAVVSVRDTGIGIDPEHLPHLFEMFSQVAPALERSQGGLGIGLALVKGLVELHGGRVEAHSDGLGKGSEFMIYLPVLDGPAAAAHQPVEHAGHSASRRRILVVDDNRDAADSLVVMLQMMGHDTEVTYDGLEGLQAAATHLPDMAVLDIGMPKMNGYDVARHIRKQPWGTGMVLIALTGWGQEEDRRRAFEAGFDHHLTKPVEAARLEKLVAAIEP
jgi:PAS domain S-box-containing protein